MRVAHLALLVSSLSLAAVAASGCSNKPEECKMVIDTIDDDDAALKGVDLDTEDFPQLSTNLKTAATLVDKVAADLASKTVKDAELSKASSDYQAFAKSLANELRSFSDLVSKLGEALRNLGPMAKSFSAGMHKLQARCEGADKTVAADCATVTTAMKQAPDQDAFKFDKDLKEDAEAFSKFAGSLKALSMSDKDLKAGLDDVVKGLGGLETLMRTLSELKPKFDASHASLRAVMAKEAPIERHINETCAAK